MLQVVAAFLLMVALPLGFAQAQRLPPSKDRTTSSTCNLASKLTGSNSPLLDRLKGTAAASTCSAAFVTLKGRTRSKRGLLLTSGHCIMMGRAAIYGGRLAVPAPGDAKDHRTLTLETGNAAAPRACIKTDELLYATLTGLDIAIYRLTETYDEIAGRTGGRPLRVAGGILSDVQVAAGLRVRMPSSYHQANYTCTTDATVSRVKEDLWTWQPVLRLAKECEARPGSSGAPIVREDTNEVVAVYGTTYNADGRPCEFNNPCEVDEEGVTSVAGKGQPYAHFVHRLHTCFDRRGNLDLSAADCPLPRPPK